MSFCHSHILHISNTVPQPQQIKDSMNPSCTILTINYVNQPTKSNITSLIFNKANLNKVYCISLQKSNYPIFIKTGKLFVSEPCLLSMLLTESFIFKACKSSHDQCFEMFLGEKENNTLVSLIQGRLKFKV